jgi:ADP-ribose pyrophosphatase
MNNLRFTIHKRETLFQGYFRIDRLHLSHERFNGGVVGPFTRELLERGHAVAVLPYDPLTDHVLLIEQFRPGPIATQDPAPWLIEIVAGIIDAGEAPEQVARRETLEEAGCIMDDMVQIQECYLSPGCNSEYCTVYVGRTNLDKAGGTFGLSDEHEDIRSHVLHLDDALDWLATGKIRTAPAIMALQWLALHRDELRDRWQSGSTTS